MKKKGCYMSKSQKEMQYEFYLKLFEILLAGIIPICSFFAGYFLGSDKFSIYYFLIFALILICLFFSVLYIYYEKIRKMSGIGKKQNFYFGIDSIEDK